MRLIELEPRWVSDGEPSHAQGIGFTCPVHRGFCMIVVPFANPIIGPRLAQGGGKNRDEFWQRSGDTFETLTLSPSIHMKDGDDGPTHWHGFITDGEVR